MRTAATLLLSLPALVAQLPQQPTPAGDWTGALEVGPTKLRVALHLSLGQDGIWQGTLDSLDQGARGLKLSGIQWKDGRLTFALTGANARFEGTLEGGQRLVGQWTQGTTTPLTFTRGQAEAVRRPQDPQPPFPYTVQEVTFPGGSMGVQLAGTLTLPAGKGPFPAVVLVHGSGPNDRDETVFNHRPFAVLADHLTRQGIAVLRYDKRGIKASTGSFAQATTHDFASDAEAALTWLAKRSEIQGKRMGLLGHSEGGIIAPLVAARSQAPAFLILLAGPAVPGEDVLYAQGEALVKAMGGSPEVVAAQRKSQEHAFALLKQHPEATPEAFAALLGAGLSPEARQAAEKTLLQQARQVANPWFRTFLGLDPRPALRQVKVPVLALFGEKDLQILPSQNRPELEKALAGHKRAEIHTFPGLNHLFQPAKTGTVQEYGVIETTMDPMVLQRVSRWIQTLWT